MDVAMSVIPRCKLSDTHKVSMTSTTSKQRALRVWIHEPLLLWSRVGRKHSISCGSVIGDYELRPGTDKVVTEIIQQITELE